MNWLKVETFVAPRNCYSTKESSEKLLWPNYFWAELIVGPFNLHFLTMGPNTSLDHISAWIWNTSLEVRPHELGLLLELKKNQLIAAGKKERKKTVRMAQVNTYLKPHQSQLMIKCSRDGATTIVRLTDVQAIVLWACGSKHCHFFASCRVEILWKQYIPNCCHSITCIHKNA